MHIKTEHLQIREFTEGDLAELEILLGDPRVMEYSDLGPLSTDQVADTFYNKILTFLHIRWAG